MEKAVTREQIHEMLDLVLDINGNEQRQQSITGNKPTAFMNFNGQVYDLDVQIHKNGWAKDDYPEISETIRLSDGTTWNGGTFDDVIKLLKSIKNDRRHKAERSQTR